MDSTLFNAAITGNIDVISSHINNQSTDQVRQQRAQHASNTILHLASHSGHTEAVQAILSKHPLLLSEVNRDGDTALHLAARGRQIGVVRVLIDSAKKLDAVNQDVESGQLQTWFGISRLGNKEGYMAVHEATRYNHIQVVTMLLQEDPRFENSDKKPGESLLYLAASRGFHDLVDLIIKACGSPSYYGPDGRTALHGAVACNSEDCTTKLLRWKQALVRRVDKYKQTPLDYAAQLGFANLVSALLSADASNVCIANNQEQNMALLRAATAGHISVMKELISHWPSCWDMVNAKGRNVLHVAIQHDQKDVIEYLLEECPWLINNLLIKKDNDGNTPLHLLATSNCFVPKLIHHPMADKGALNNKGLTPLGKTKSSTSAAKNEITEELTRVGDILHLKNVGAHDLIDSHNDVARKAVGNHMVVAALIATVAFTAGFAMPGGYIQSGSDNQGMAVLSRDSVAFQAFVISDAVALLFSTSALFTYFISSLYHPLYWQDEIRHCTILGIYLNIFGLGAIIVAFITGTYAVLHYSYTLAIATSVVASSTFLIHFALLTRHLFLVN